MATSCRLPHGQTRDAERAQDGRKMVAKPKKWDTVFCRYPIDFIWCARQESNLRPTA